MMHGKLFGVLMTLLFCLNFQLAICQNLEYKVPIETKDISKTAVTDRLKKWIVSSYPRHKSQVIISDPSTISWTGTTRITLTKGRKDKDYTYTYQATYVPGDPDGMLTINNIQTKTTRNKTYTLPAKEGYLKFIADTYKVDKVREDKLEMAKQEYNQIEYRIENLVQELKTAILGI